MSLSEVGSVEGDAAVLAKVVSARRRIMLASLARCLCVTLFIAMVIATIAIAMLAVIPIENGESPLETTPWIIGWLVGSAAIALLGSVAWTPVDSSIGQGSRCGNRPPFRFAGTTEQFDGIRPCDGVEFFFRAPA